MSITLSENKAWSLTKTGLVVTELLSYETYEGMGALFGDLDNTLKWAVGDWLLYGEKMYGESAAQASEALGFSAERRMQYLRVAQAIPPKRRRASISWSHHRCVYALSETEQEYWLDEARLYGWSKRELELQMRESPAIQDRGVNPTSPSSPPDLPYVVEGVREAALEVCQSAELNGQGYYVPREPVERLRVLLGFAE